MPRTKMSQATNNSDTSIPIVKKNKEGKLLQFFPLQRHLLLTLRQNGLFKGHGYMGMCLVHDYYLFLDRPVKVNPKHFCDRWGICTSYYYKGVQELVKHGLIKTSKPYVIVCSQFVKIETCPISEPPYNKEQFVKTETCPISEPPYNEDIFHGEKVSSWRKKILQLETNLETKPLHSKGYIDSLDINITRGIKENKIKHPPSFINSSFIAPDISQEKGGLGETKMYQVDTTSDEVEIELYHSGQRPIMETKYRGENNSYSVCVEVEEIKPVVFSQESVVPVQREIVQGEIPAALGEPTGIQVSLEEEFEDDSWGELVQRKEGTDQEQGDITHLALSKSDICDATWDVCVDHSSAAPADEVLDAEVVVEVVEDVSEKTDALALKTEEKLQGGCSSLQTSEGEVEYPPEVQRAIALYEETGTVPRVRELNMWAEVEIGEYVKLYRKSGRVLSSKPNDVIPEFRKFLIEKKQAANPIAWISAMERNPQRWGELADMVQEFREIEFKKSDEGKSLRIEYYKSKGCEELGHIQNRWKLN